MIVDTIYNNHVNFTFVDILIIYLIIINLISFFVIGYDKMKANLNHRRVPEKTLWFLALIGGSLGTLSGMSYFRHKTQKNSFQLVLAIILALQTIILYYLLVRQP